MRTVRVNVKGRVQGVYFRYSTRKIAIKYNITGWVKNMDDGSVQFEAKGEEENMADFLAEIKKGPSKKSKVQEMQVTELEGNSQFTTFDIK